MTRGQTRTLQVGVVVAPRARILRAITSALNTSAAGHSPLSDQALHCVLSALVFSSRASLNDAFTA